MRTLELIEERAVWLSPGEVSPEQAIQIHANKKFTLEWPNPGNSNSYGIRSNGWVGHIPIADVMLIVEPKVPVRSIFAMLETAYQLKSFQLLQGQTSIATLAEVYERIAAILAGQVLDRLRRGLYRSYITHNDDLQFVRGRIDIRNNLHNVVNGIPRLRCTYEDLTPDLDDNQLILWALYVCSRTDLQRDEVKARVRRAYRGLVGSVVLDPKRAGEYVNRTYHRLNDDYRPMHALSRLVIEHAGPGIKSGRHEFVPFAVDMPQLFEQFVAELLHTSLPEHLVVKRQYPMKLYSNSDLTFIADLVVRRKSDDRAVCVLDTKYKFSDSPAQADIQQVVAYAVELGVRHAFLVYPFALAHPVTARIGHVVVQTCSLDLERSITSEAELLETICSVVVD
jgi:5-methylcytosine-specific restriction enzyme subunit McrC